MDMYRFPKPVRNKLQYEEWKIMSERTWKFFIEKHCSKVPDVGAGSGKNAIFAPDSIKYWAIDISPKGKNYIREDQHFICCDAINTPFDNESFDGIILSHIIEHFRELGSSFDEMKRLLKPSGILYIEAPNDTYPYFYHDFTHVRPYPAIALRALLKANGFHNIIYGDILYPIKRGGPIFRFFYRVIRANWMKPPHYFSFAVGTK